MCFVSQGPTLFPLAILKSWRRNAKGRKKACLQPIYTSWIGMAQTYKWFLPIMWPGPRFLRYPNLFCIFLVPTETLAPLFKQFQLGRNLHHCFKGLWKEPATWKGLYDWRIYFLSVLLLLLFCCHPCLQLQFGSQIIMERER